MPRTVVEIPQEVKEQMRRDYRRGMSLKEVSAIYGVGRNKTFYICLDLLEHLDDAKMKGGAE